MKKPKGEKELLVRSIQKKEPPVEEARTAVNVEDTIKFCNEFSKALEHIYYGGICDENDDIETCKTNLIIQGFI